MVIFTFFRYNILETTHLYAICIQELAPISYGKYIETVEKFGPPLSKFELTLLDFKLHMYVHTLFEN